MSLLIYFAVYFLLGFVLRSLLVYRRTGHNPFVLPTGDDADSYVGRAFKLVILAIVVLVVLHAAAPELLLRTAGALPALQGTAFGYAGWALLLMSLLWLAIAQAQMGNSWRIGIDRGNATELVSTGLFAVSRNPIFLSMRVSLLGLLLVLPNTATLAIGVAGELLMQVQVRLEEAHLARLHRERYAAYRARVRRWL